MANHSFQFEVITKNLKPIVIKWLSKPHVAEWWHGEGLESTLQSLEQFLRGDSLNPTPWVGYYNERPFSYISAHQLSPQDSNCIFSPWINEEDEPISIDILIGNTSLLGKGLAVSMILSFLKNHCQKTTKIFIDPEVKNTRAIHVYEKVGFKKCGHFIAPWNPVPHVAMVLERT